MSLFQPWGKQCFFVAELSANHGNSLEHAEALIRAAAAAGADAVKVQTYTPDALTLPLNSPLFQSRSPAFHGRSLYDVYSEGALPYAWHQPLQVLTHSLGMEFFSTPFDPAGVDFLESLNVPCYKVASFELVDIPLLQRIAATAKPILLSTGMANLAEIDEAVRTLRTHNSGPFILLKCTSAYPAPPEEANLRTLPHMAAAFHCPVGLSDHTLGTALPVAAVALGACVIEKHFALSRDDATLDASFSMNPEEFQRMVNDVRTIERALGQISYDLTPKQERSREIRRSLFVVQDMAPGDPFTPANVRSIRPGAGLHTRFLPDIIGRKARHALAKGTPLGWELVE